MFSIVIPVLHEEVNVNPLIERLCRQFPDESFEVIIVDGDPQGSTIKAVQNSDILTTVSKPGRGNQMNKGARLARGEVLIFLHADTKLPPNAFQHIRTVLADTRYVAGAFKLGFESPRWIFRFLETTASWRYRLTRFPYGDQAFFMPRDYFFQIGGFQDIPIMEDIDLMRRIKHRREKVHISTTVQVKTSARRWEKEGIVYSVLRTWILASLYCIGVSPYTLLKHYRHHKEKNHNDRQKKS